MDVTSKPKAEVHHPEKCCLPSLSIELPCNDKLVVGAVVTHPPWDNCSIASTKFTALVAQASVWDASGTPPDRGIPGMFH